MATVSKTLIWEGTLEPLETRWATWNYNIYGHALYFYAVPSVGQNSFPQAIEIQQVRMEHTEAIKWRARIKLHNPTPPRNIPQKDVLFYEMYLVVFS
jgi:hypothetical protein